jgi:hypothetical protein
VSIGHVQVKDFSVLREFASGNGYRIIETKNKIMVDMAF